MFSVFCRESLIPQVERFKMANSTTLLEQSIERKLTCILRNTILENTCLIWQGKSRAGQYGRVCFQYPGQGPGSVQMSVSRAVFILHHRRPDLVGGGEGDVSHRCQRPLCINLKHLTLESRSANTQRRTCKRDGSCYGCQPPCIFD